MTAAARIIINEVKGLNILVDCGSIQGDDTAVSLEDWPVSVSDINYLFLTHAHIDHICLS